MIQCGVNNLEVEKGPSGPIIYPRGGDISAIIPITGGKRAEFAGADITGVSFHFNEQYFVIKYNPKKSSE